MKKRVQRNTSRYPIQLKRWKRYQAEHAVESQGLTLRPQLPNYFDRALEGASQSESSEHMILGEIQAECEGC